MMLSKNIKIILAVIVVAVVGYIGFSYLGSSTEEEGNEFNGLSSEVPDTGTIGKELMATLETIRKIQLDRGVLVSPEFSSLRDFSIQINPEPVGRENPFAPVRGVVTPPVTPRR